MAKKATEASVERLAQWLHEQYLRHDRAERRRPGLAYSWRLKPQSWADSSEVSKDSYRAVARVLLERPPAVLRRALAAKEG